MRRLSFVYNSNVNKTALEIESAALSEIPYRSPSLAKPWLDDKNETRENISFSNSLHHAGDQTYAPDGLRVIAGRLLQDPSLPQAALPTQQLLQRFRWDVFDHPTYSPDFAPRDYHLSQLLKRFLVKLHFPSDDDMQTDVCHKLTSLSGGGSFRHR
ncbi:hypothetical protein AVEN_127894-1 [Araneus ventricosus]|uniref:Histone-lysine N-methyltransferase SETMAR n=1 Tax=Araneus ventricosus TaxID=182803 RepID=A0A4Y1ZYQ6_ARAVE|nr:hypothetical protein AVEN_127894-1 [Araneus ventricosus]